MRVVTAFALSFFVTLFIAALIFPVPPAKPKSSARPVVARTASNPFELLPPPAAPLGLLTSSSQPYEAAQGLIMNGRLREAQDVYLQILLARSPIDQKALQGLARVEGLLAHGDAVTLRRQADGYRRAIAEGATDASYTPRELELLAEASLLAAQQIRAEQAPLSTSVGSRVPRVSDIPQNRLRRLATPAQATRPAPSAIVQQVVRLGSSVNPASTGTEIISVEKPASSEASITIPIPLPDSPAGNDSPGTSDSGTGSSSGWGSAGKVGTESGRTGSDTSWGTTNGGAPQPNKRPSGQ